jgi:hypothetical protein
MSNLNGLFFFFFFIYLFYFILFFYVKFDTLLVLFLCQIEVLGIRLLIKSWSFAFGFFSRMVILFYFFPWEIHGMYLS